MSGIVSETDRFFHEYVDEYQSTARVALVPTHQANVCIRAADSVIKYNLHHALISHPNVNVAGTRDATQERETVCFPIETQGKYATQVMGECAGDVSELYRHMLFILDRAVADHKTRQTC